MGRYNGDDTTRWPRELSDTLGTLGAIALKNDILAAICGKPCQYKYDGSAVVVLQNLRISEGTYPAFEAGMVVVAPDILRSYFK